MTTLTNRDEHLCDHLVDMTQIRPPNADYEPAGQLQETCAVLFGLNALVDLINTIAVLHAPVELDSDLEIGDRNINVERVSSAVDFRLGGG